jgi:predicted SAM-dependent methyltransferase
VRIWSVALPSLRPIRQRVRDVLVSGEDSQATFREDLARRYVRGDGIEIGPLQHPLRLPPGARVRYVDVMSREQLLATHPSAVYGDPRWVVEPDVIDDCERLGTFADGSLDFVIANHVLEHTEDPIGALENLVRVLRPTGVLFLALPDARYTFDAWRERTTIEHLLRDHNQGPEGSRFEHYREWAHIDCLPEEKIPERVAELAREAARHHFHVWELDGFLELLRALDLPVSLELAQAHLDAFVVILRRQESAA